MYLLGTQGLIERLFLSGHPFSTYYV